VDPDEALKRVREALASFHDAREAPEELDFAHELAGAFTALDGWLQAGGFLPKDWQPKK
jgi:hypothetical protein